MIEMAGISGEKNDDGRHYGPRQGLTAVARFENNYFTEMSSSSNAGSYLRLIDFAYHSTLGLRVLKKRRRGTPYLCQRTFP